MLGCTHGVLWFSNAQSHVAGSLRIEYARRICCALHCIPLSVPAGKQGFPSFALLPIGSLLAWTSGIHFFLPTGFDDDAKVWPCFLLVYFHGLGIL